MSFFRDGDIAAPGHVDRALMFVALAAFAMLLTAYCVLSIAGRDPDGILRLVVNLAGVFGVGSVLNYRTAANTRKLDELKPVVGQIHEQTNGVLRQKIADASAESMRQVLGEYGLKPKAPPTDGNVPAV